jgi:ribosomal protein S18 acetylase RimI-like enzyme
MKIVNAVWEMRNLGVICTEVTVEHRDSDEGVLAQLSDLPAGYQVIKVPVARVDIMNSLHRANFAYVESSISVEHELSINHPEGLFARMVSASEYVELGSDEIDRVSLEIRSDMFRTDRVYLDPEFTREQAANRYVNWMMDEVSRGASVYELRVKNAGIGFFLFRHDSERVGYSALAGLYPSSKSPGFGNVLLHQVLLEAKQRQLIRLESHVSSNNLAVVKNHIEQGFRITDIHYVYVRHTIKI